jgi:hypothetical protein
MRYPAVLVFVLLSAGLASAAPASDDGFFQEKILPLLQKHCYACHSHAAGKMKGGLALDSRSGWEQGGASGPTLVPGQPEKSRLVQAIRHTDADLKMPPKGKLPDAEIALLVEWVQRGAPDPRITAKPNGAGWWSLAELTRSPVPAVPDGDTGVRHPIDAFILARLREKGLFPSTEADRRSLIRRLTFDLHGLPPTPEDVEAFVRDADPHAYEKLVDRLLASPQYGERMARLWLDVVHYGESNGYGMDRPRMNAWPYRDYVIRSFNEDKPYARFTQEQLAADALFRDEPALTPALGFLAAGPFNQSALAEQVDGTLCKKIALNLDRDDMVSSVAATFLSVTLHCARCHDHKFDPLTQRDYYRMQSVFAGVVRGDREFDTDVALARQRQRWRMVRQRLDSGTAFAALDPADRDELSAVVSDTEKAVSAAEQPWQVLNISVLADSGVPKVVAQPDGSVRFEGDTADKDTYVLAARTPLESVAALRLEVLADDTLPQHGPGRNPANGNFHLSEIRLMAAPLDAPEKIAPVKVRTALSDFSQSGWEIGKVIDGKPDTAWGIHPKEGQSHQAVFVFDKPVAHKGGALLTIRLEQLHGSKHMIGRLRLSAAAQEPSPSVLVSPDVLMLLKTPPAQRTEADQQRLLDALARLTVEQKLAALPPVQTVWAVGKDLPAFRNYKPAPEPSPIHILRRGDVTQPLEEVAPGAPEVVTMLQSVFELSNPKDEAARRAALAEWVTNERNPLTWRSIANRLWLWHFDRGLVETPNDFGRMGSPPSHPELLDWLACEFRDSGGSFKRLHRLIVTSATYRQSSPPAGEAAKQDNDNRLLWRMNRRRLDAEQLRDALLAVSGKLDLTQGGPPAMQFKYSDPNKEVSPLIDYDGFDPDQPSGRRRAVYRFLFRNVNDPLLDAFDSANPSLSTPKRDATVTPLQALSLFNDRFVLRQCEHLAARLQREAANGPDQIDRAFRLLYARPPTPDEAALVADFARQHGLVHACRVLVNANEFLFLP